MMLTIFIGFILTVCLKQYLISEIMAVAAASLAIFSLGFWDDLKWKNIPDPRPYRKFAGLIIFPLLSAFILSAVGIKINFFNFFLLDYLLTFFYIFVLVNSINYEDGIDGLAGGMSLLSLAAFSVVSLLANNEFALFLSLIAGGSVLGFLLFNFPPAKIFMGDSGAFFLGFVLSVFATLLVKPYDLFSLLGVIFISGFPIFEGVFTNIRRILSKKSIFLGDREHLYDKLYLKKGFSIYKTLLICYSIQIIFIIIGFIFFYANTFI